MASPAPLPQRDVVFQLKLSLRDVDPLIWRRIEVPDCTLADLHVIAQIVMDWEENHLHEFVVGTASYGPIDEMGDDVDDEGSILLSEIFTSKKPPRVLYIYDLGDEWQVDVVLESKQKPEPKVKYPRCVAGELAGPPEDVGGPHGYNELIEAISDPKHPGHDEAKEWLGNTTDRTKFSLGSINTRLRKVF